MTNTTTTTLTITQALEDQARGVALTKANDPEVQHLAYQPFIEPASRPNEDLVHLGNHVEHCYRVHRRNAMITESIGYALTDLAAEDDSYAAPTTKWDAEAVEAAVAEQRRTFGDLRPSVKGVHTSYKVAKKVAALDRSLNAAFAPRKAFFGEQLSLDTQQDYGWTPSEEDTTVEDQDTTETTLRDIYSRLTAKQQQVAELLLDGHTHAGIASILGISRPVVTKTIHAMRSRLAR